MKPEHVLLKSDEKSYGEKQLLNSQLEILKALKRFDAYKTLRSEELMLKIALKNKINDAMKSLDLLDKLLPKPTIKQEKAHKKKHYSKTERHQQSHSNSLEKEAREIKEKLARLR